MKCKNFGLFCLLIMGSAQSLLAQQAVADFAKMSDVVPPPPNAASIIKSGMAAVNKNTGAPSVSIPLYSIKGQQLATSVSLSYSSTGIKVDDVSGRAGMGWTLNAGGVVTRTVRGAKDEGNSRIELNQAQLGTCAGLTFLERAASSGGGYDSEPDLFNFNMDGHSGSFVLDASLNPVTSDQSKYKIDKNFSGTIWNFKITTAEGIIYYFGGTNAKERSKRNSTCGKIYSDYIDNAWYLTKIENTNGEKIEFIYTQHPYKYDNGVTEARTWAVPQCGQSRTSYPCVNIMQTDGRLLTEIFNEFTSISFSYQDRGSTEEDKLVSNIQIRDKKQPSIINNQFNFNYDPRSGLNTYDYTYTLGQDKTYYLIGLTETSMGNQFTRSHSFAYKSPELRPYRASYAQDHWGYFNGQHNSTLLPAPSDPVTAANFLGANANREASATHAEMGMLKTIYYPTGGREDIEYEANNYYSTLSASNIDAGGVRVKKISMQNPGESAIVKKYYYADITSMSQSSLKERYTPTYVKSYTAPASNPSYTECGTIGIYSNSLIAAVSYQNAPVSYASVIESYGENFEGGAIQYKYNTYADAAAYMVQGLPIEGAPLTNASNALNGKPEEEIMYKKGPSGLFPIKKTVYHYKQDSRVQNIVYGYRAYLRMPMTSWPSCSNPTNSATQTDLYDIARYEFRSSWVYLEQKEETLFDENGNNPLVQVTDYTYTDPVYRQLTKTETTESNGTTLTTGFKYPQDYGSTYNGMVNENMISKVIGYKETKTVAAIPVVEIETAYTNTIPFVPTMVKKKYGTAANFITEGTFNQYDSKGNLLEYTDKAGLTHSIIWGYNYLYPVAKISGATYASAIAALTGSNVVALQTMDGTALLTELHKIRTALPNALVASFTYKHLAGITVAVDANNKKTSYEYDSFNRLSVVRDQDNNLLKKICYNYQGQAEDCIAANPCPPDPQPIWQNTGNTRCQVNNTTCAYTGYQEIEQSNINTCVTVSNQWVTGPYNPTACANSGLVKLAVVNNTGATNLTVTITQTAPVGGIPQSFTIPTGTTPLVCLLTGKNNKYSISITANGIQLAGLFTLGGITVTGTPASFGNMSFVYPPGGGTVNIIIDPDL